MKQTTAQLILNKFDELRWIEFCIWLNDNREIVAKHNKDDIEYFLNKIRDMQFMGSDLEVLTRIDMKLQNKYTNLNKLCNYL